MTPRLDWGDKAAFALVVVAALFLAHQLFNQGKDAGAVALLGAAAALLSGYWSQVNATAARDAALLAPSPSQTSSAMVAAVMAARPSAPMVVATGPASPPPPPSAG